MDLGINNKIALIIGGTKGIGFAISKQLLDSKCKICIMSRSEENLNSAKKELQELGYIDIHQFQGDASIKSDMQMLYKFHKEKVGFPDIIINNCGGPPMGNYDDHDDAVWQKTFEQTFLPIVRLTKLFSDNMINNKWGRFINISSSVAIEPSSIMILSASMRAALAAFSKSISLSFAETGITINTICPGGVATDRLLSLVKTQAETRNESFEKILEESQQSIPMKRFAKPEELADLALFLCSSRASYITGRVHVIDGGLTKSF